VSAASEERATDGEGCTRKLGFLQYLGYGFGDAANNLTFMMASSFLLIYYTDVHR
jgi:glucuronide carrier protein